jgi:peptidoglycan/xylan/chitin deacetylase (PgdA/CDA1 family)
MIIRNFKCTFGKIVRVVFNAILLAGLVFPGTLAPAVKASSEASYGLEKTQNGPNDPMAEPEYTLTITSLHGTVTKTPNQATYHAGDVVHLTQTPNPGYTFDHWSNSTSGASMYEAGGVAITFDDGYLSTYTDLYPYMKSKGIPGTIYAICSWVDYNQGGLTSAQLEELDLNGWSIGNHTYSHAYLDTLTEAQQEAELLGCKNFLNGIGLSKASSHVAYPYAIWNTDTLTAMTNTGMLTGRAIISTTFDPKTGFLYALPGDTSDSLAAVEQKTTDAVSNHQIFIYYGHQIGQSGDLSLADFKAWMDYLALNKIPTLTINDVYARTFMPLDITITGNIAITANYTQLATISGNVGIGGAILNYAGGNPIVADASGNYTISVRSGSSGTVTPSKLGSAFTPSSRTYSNVSGNLTGQNYTAAHANTPPVISGGTDASVTMSMNGTPTPFALTVNATDADPSDTLTWSISSAASHGTASASGTGNSKAISYTPTNNYVGSDSFVVQVSDGTASDTMTVYVTIVGTPIYALSITKVGAGSGTVTSTPAGINCGATCAANFDLNTSVTLTATAALGSTFTGWSGAGCSGTDTCGVTMTTAKSVTATFTQNAYTLSITSLHGTVAKNPSKTTYIYGDVVALTATADAGWTFANWTGDASGSTNPGSVTMNGNKSVTANYTQDQYTLSITSLHGTVAKNPSKTTYTYGDVVALTATADTGWTFANWTGDASGSTNPGSVTMNGNRSVTANYTQNQYTLSITSLHGTVAKNPSKTTYTYGEVVELTATADAGWTFANWTGDAGGSTNPGSVTMNGNRSVTANYTQNEYTLTLNVNGNGSITRDKAGPYHYGDIVELTAVPDPDWGFSAWSVDLTGIVNPSSITIDGNKSITAIFTRLFYKVYMPIVYR